MKSCLKFLILFVVLAGFTNSALSQYSRTSSRSSSSSARSARGTASAPSQTANQDDDEDEQDPNARKSTRSSSARSARGGAGSSARSARGSTGQSQAAAPAQNSARSSSGSSARSARSSAGASTGQSSARSARGSTGSSARSARGSGAQPATQTGGSSASARRSARNSSAGATATQSTQSSARSARSSRGSSGGSSVARSGMGSEPITVSVPQSTASGARSASSGGSTARSATARTDGTTAPTSSSRRSASTSSGSTSSRTAYVSNYYDHEPETASQNIDVKDAKLCQEQYFKCMDDYCDDKLVDEDSIIGRCLCAKTYEDYADSKKELDTMISRINQMISSIAGLEVKRQSGKLGSNVYKAYTEEIAAELGFNELAEVTDYDDVDYGTSSPEDKIKEGAALYKDAHNNCTRYLELCPTSGVTGGYITGIYANEVAKSCRVYEKELGVKKKEYSLKIQKLYNQYQEKERKLAASDNKYDAAACFDALSTCMQSDDFCGATFQHCETEAKLESHKINCSSVFSNCKNVEATVWSSFKTQVLNKVK